MVTSSDQMKLINNGTDWHIEGEDSERAVVAYARNIGGALVYEFQPALDDVDSSRLLAAIVPSESDPALLMQSATAAP